MLEKNIDDYWNIAGDREFSDIHGQVSQDSLHWLKNHGISLERDWQQTNDLKAWHFVARDVET